MKTTFGSVFIFEVIIKERKMKKTDEFSVIFT